MKKNKMMRLASGLLVAVLITTSTISGTFAKYVTTTEAEDSARVAKFGVQLSAAGSLFAETYVEGTDTGVPGTGAVGEVLTVKSSNGDNLVAPGTKNDTGMTFTISGKPEVAVNVDVQITADGTNPAKEVLLPTANGYIDWTVATVETGYDQTFDLADDYYPVVFTLTDGSTELAKGNLAEIQKYFDDNVNDDYMNFEELSTVIPGTYVLTWEWAFEGPYTANGANIDAETVDKADTYLGNVAAEIHTDDTAVTDVEVNLAITVTQID